MQYPKLVRYLHNKTENTFSPTLPSAQYDLASYNWFLGNRREILIFDLTIPQSRTISMEHFIIGLKPFSRTVSTKLLTARQNGFR